MSSLTASVLNNFADLALSLPPQTLEITIKQNPTLVNSTGKYSVLIFNFITVFHYYLIKISKLIDLLLFIWLGKIELFLLEWKRLF